MNYPVFLYTGAKEVAGVQIVPQLSLGGFYASSIIPNAQMFNLYSDVALLASETFNVRAVVFANLTDVDPEPLTFTDTRMWFQNKSDNGFYYLEMGAHVLAASGEMQLLNSPYQLPYGVVFKSYYLLPTSIATGLPIPADELKSWNPEDVEYDPDSDYNNGTLFPDGTPQPIGEEVPNYAVIGEMAPGDKVVIWFKRVTDRAAIAEYFKCNTIWSRFIEEHPNFNETGYGELNPDDPDNVLDYSDFDKIGGIDINYSWDDGVEGDLVLMVTGESTDPNLPGEADLMATNESAGLLGSDPRIKVTPDSEA